jgi:hypothetical protein
MEKKSTNRGSGETQRPAVRRVSDPTDEAIGGVLAIIGGSQLTVYRFGISWLTLRIDLQNRF